MQREPHGESAAGAPLVTVGLPFFNGAHTLGLAVTSVLEQTFTDFELLLVNDGSTDDAPRIARSFSDARVRLVDDGANRGLVARLNQISRLASGAYIARMDADDVSHPDRLRRQVEWLTAHPATDVVATGAWVIDEHDRVVGARHQSLLPPEPRKVIGHGFLLHPTVMARREWHAANPYDEQYLRAEDKELWARTWQPEAFHRLPEPLLYYRESSQLRPAPYRTGCRSDREMLRVYGPSMVGLAGTARALARSVVVEAVSLAAHRCGLDRSVIRARNRRLPEERRAAAQEQLDRLRTHAAAAVGAT